MWENICLHDKESAIKRAQERFTRVLTVEFGEPAFVLMYEYRGYIEGASITAVLYLSRFIEMFGDLVEREDYRIESYLQRNKERDFGIDESVFESWKNAGCLRD